MELKSQINKAEQQKDIKTLEEIQENAEIGFEGEIAGLAKAALDRLHGKVEDAEKTPDHVVEKLGEEKLEEVTAEVDKEIEALQQKTEGEIEGVVGDGKLEKSNWKPEDGVENYPEEPLVWTGDMYGRDIDRQLMKFFEFRFDRPDISPEIKKYIFQNFPADFFEERLPGIIRSNFYDIALDNPMIARKKMDTMIASMRDFLPDKKINEGLALALDAARLPNAGNIQNSYDKSNKDDYSTENYNKNMGQIKEDLSLLNITNYQQMKMAIELKRQVEINEVYQKYNLRSRENFTVVNLLDKTKIDEKEMNKEYEKLESAKQEAEKEFNEYMKYAAIIFPNQY